MFLQGLAGKNATAGVWEHFCPLFEDVQPVEYESGRKARDKAAERAGSRGRASGARFSPAPLYTKKVVIFS